jgi:hypothetical protein
MGILERALVISIRAVLQGDNSWVRRWKAPPGTTLERKGITEMAAAPDILFHRYFQQQPAYRRAIYRGKQELDAIEPPLQDLLRALQANLNEALRNERQDVPEHVPHPPFHMDFIDSDDANALAFTEGDYSFIGITVALIRRIWGICLPLVQAPDVGILLGLPLDTEERRTRLHALFFRLQLNFVTTHEYTHHVHGHTGESSLDSPFASEINSNDENCDMETQVFELDADTYGAYHVLANLYATERAYAAELLGFDGSAPDREDQKLFACFVLAAGSFLFVRRSTVLTPENIYRLCHPAQATRMDFIMRSAVGWCRIHRPALAAWMNPDIFGRIMNTVATVMPGADGGHGWAAQTRFLQTEVGDAYMKSLARDLEHYIQNL